MKAIFTTIGILIVLYILFGPSVLKVVIKALDSLYDLVKYLPYKGII